MNKRQKKKRWMKFIKKVEAVFKPAFTAHLAEPNPLEKLLKESKSE